VKLKRSACIALALTVIILLSLFAGCGQQQTTAEKTEQPQVQQTDYEAEDTQKISSLEDLVGKKVGVLTGDANEMNVRKYIPGCELEFFNSVSDLATALVSGKIDAFADDESTERFILKQYPQFGYLDKLCDCYYASVFPKTEAGQALCDQMSKYLTEIHTNGIMAEIDAVWFGDDEAAKTVDFGGLTGENGTLSMAVSTSVGYPFCYIKDGNFVGYDIDIAVRFCRAYGYDLRLFDYDFAGFLAAVSVGKCDFGASGVTVSEERKESVLFSEPNYYSASVIVALKENIEKSAAEEYALSLSAVDKDSFTERFAGKRVGLVTGSIFDLLAAEYLPESTVEYINSSTDLALALETGRIDAYIADEPTVRMIQQTYEEQYICAAFESITYGYAFPKGSEKSNRIRAQMDEFLTRLRTDGTLEEIDTIWFGKDESKKVVDFRDLNGENGEISYAVCTDVGAPFAYVTSDQYAGYDVDIVARFCREYGYSLKISDYALGGLLAGIAGGKCDLGSSGLGITEERKESMNFSVPNYEGGIVLVTKDSFEGQQESGNQFLQSVKDGFQKTFLRENRWQLFLNGIAVTLIITVISAVCGTLIAFLIYLIYRKNFFLPNLLVNLLSDILQKTPVVVILMILYYLIFGKASLDGVWVSCIGFSLIFSCSVLDALKVAVGAVDAGQTEAAQALGYTDTRAFLRIILPQAMQHFLPVYQGEIVTLIKATAIVGYIAVQDLTKVSDIVRSRTYEAFFPLIASAVIYFAAAWVLTLLVRRVRIKSDPKRRSSKKVLKGVHTK